MTSSRTLTTSCTLTTSRRLRRSGFTLIEVMLALLFLLLALEITAQLLRETQQVFVEEARKAQDPVADLLARQLRVDIMAARQAAPASPLWTTLPLSLTGGPYQVVYRVTDDGLERGLFAADGTPLGARVFVRQLRSWRWRVPDLDAQLVDVDLAWATTSSDTARWTSPRLPPPAERLETLTVRFSPRGGGGSTW